MARKRKRRTRRRNPGLRHSGELVAQWASQGGRYWLKLYRSGDGTYSYQTDHGGGWSHTAAKIKKIVRDQLSFMPSKMRRVKVARTRNPRRPGPIYRGPITGAGQNKKLGRADAARDHKRRAISPRTGNPSYDYAYADKWATLTGVDLWNNDAWQRSYLNPGRLSPHATAAQLGQGRTRNAAGYQNLRNIPPHRKGRYPNPALTKTQIQNLWTINHLNIRRMSAIIRRGDKQAAALLRKGLVRIERQATYQTPGGKLGTGNVFRLTAKGKQALGSYEP